MRVSTALIDQFNEPLEEKIKSFLLNEHYLTTPEDLKSRRFLTRSVVPHVEALSQLFNRLDPDQPDSVDQKRYYADTKNRKNRMLSYFLSFMPGNAFRAAAVLDELKRLGFVWTTPSSPNFRAVEFGAGVASAAFGCAEFDRIFSFFPDGPKSFALIEADKPTLHFGEKWFNSVHNGSWSTRTFPHRIEVSQRWLPKTAPTFHFMISSFFLNESVAEPSSWAEGLFETLEHHLENEGLFVLVEPALRTQSRKVLELRAELLKKFLDHPEFKILTPCLGHQTCGALKSDSDWCHEEVRWWRPPYLRLLDELTSLDRKSLPMTSLVIARSRRSRTEILPALHGSDTARYRLVSPSHSVGPRDVEFFLCGQEGKRRAQWRAERKTVSTGLVDGADLQRGDILQNAELSGDFAQTKVESFD